MLHNVSLSNPDVVNACRPTANIRSVECERYLYLDKVKVVKQKSLQTVKDITEDEVPTTRSTDDAIC